MNFYKRFIGDIQRDTGHLSCAEMGVYDRLLDHYYATGQPVPGDLDACCRIARAMTKDERKSVESVLNQYFELTDSGYEQGRAKKEIEEAQPKIEAARENGLKGGRPKKTNSETQQKPTGFFSETQHKPNSKASQSQSQIKTSVLDTGEQIHRDAAPASTTLAGQCALAIKQAGIVDINPTNPKFIKLVEAGATADEFHAAALEAVHAGKPRFAYVIGVVMGRRKEAENMTIPPPSRSGSIRPKTVHETRAETAAAMFGDMKNEPRIIDITDATEAETHRQAISQDGDHVR